MTIQAAREVLQEMIKARSGEQGNVVDALTATIGIFDDYENMKANSGRIMVDLQSFLDADTEQKDKIKLLEQELAYHNQWAKDIAKELGCADAAQYRNDAIEVIRKWRTCVVKGGASCVY